MSVSYTHLDVYKRQVTDFTVYRETKRFPNPSQEVILRVFTKIRLKNYGSVLGKKGAIAVINAFNLANFIKDMREQGGRDADMYGRPKPPIGVVSAEAWRSNR